MTESLNTRPAWTRRSAEVASAPSVLDQSAPPVLAVHELGRMFNTKTGEVTAVKQVSFSVAQGEIVGLLGPNGAGKTTTLRMISTLLAPSTGSATICGADLQTQPRLVRSRIGYVAQGGSTNDDERVIDELILQARLFGLGKTQALNNALELLQRLDLAGLESRICKQLSGGQRRRVDIALGIIHQPGLIYLDEPTTGLDPQSRANLWDHIFALRAAGATIVLTTHYLEEADVLCDRVLVMDHGEIVAVGTPDELKRRISGDVISLEINPAHHEGAIAIADAVLTVRSRLTESNRVHLTVEHGDAAVVPLLKALDDAGIVPNSLTVKRPSLDDVFLTLTGRSLREGQDA